MFRKNKKKILKKYIKKVIFLNVISEKNIQKKNSKNNDKIIKEKKNKKIKNSKKLEIKGIRKNKSKFLSLFFNGFWFFCIIDFINKKRKKQMLKNIFNKKTKKVKNKF